MDIEDAILIQKILAKIETAPVSLNGNIYHENKAGIVDALSVLQICPRQDLDMD